MSRSLRRDHRERGCIVIRFLEAAERTTLLEALDTAKRDAQKRAALAAFTAYGEPFTAELRDKQRALENLWNKCADADIAIVDGKDH
jgi:hypothetical protein